MQFMFKCMPICNKQIFLKIFGKYVVLPNISLYLLVTSCPSHNSSKVVNLVVLTYNYNVCTSKNGTFFLYFCHYSLLTLVTKNIYAELGNKLLEKRPFMPLPPYLCLSRWSLLLPRDCQILFCFVNSFRGSFKAFRLTLHEQRLQ